MSSETFHDFMDNDPQQEQPSFEDALAELKSQPQDLPSPDVLYGLSNLNDEQIEALAPIWAKLDVSYRRMLAQMMVDVSEANFELDYHAIGHANLKAADPDVRQAAIELLWEDESLDLLRELRRMAQQDPALEVRIEAIRALGRFVLLGEWEELPEEEALSTQNELLVLAQDEDEPLDIRRQALESVANCTRSDIPPLISAAYHSEEETYRLSAVVAMGRSCDAARWEQPILEELTSATDATLRREAVRAAGELQLAEAVPGIVRLLREGEREDQEVGIWALGEIGGREATRILETLLEGAEQAEDDDLQIIIDDALGNANLASGEFMMIDFHDMDDVDFDNDE